MSWASRNPATRGWRELPARAIDAALATSLCSLLITQRRIKLQKPRRDKCKVQPNLRVRAKESRSGTGLGVNLVWTSLPSSPAPSSPIKADTTCPSSRARRPPLAEVEPAQPQLPSKGSSEASPNTGSNPVQLSSRAAPPLQDAAHGPLPRLHQRWAGLDPPSHITPCSLPSPLGGHVLPSPLSSAVCASAGFLLPRTSCLGTDLVLDKAVCTSGRPTFRSPSSLLNSPRREACTLAQRKAEFRRAKAHLFLGGNPLSELPHRRRLPLEEMPDCTPAAAKGERRQCRPSCILFLSVPASSTLLPWISGK